MSEESLLPSSPSQPTKIPTSSLSTAPSSRPSVFLSFSLTENTQAERLSAILSGKDTTKLQEGLSNDLLVRSKDDPSVMGEEQHSSEHHTMLQRRTITGLSTDNRQHHHHLLTMGETPQPLTALVGGADDYA